MACLKANLNGPQGKQRDVADICLVKPFPGEIMRVYNYWGLPFQASFIEWHLIINRRLGAEHGSSESPITV